jgi:hypothetical protein
MIVKVVNPDKSLGGNSIQQLASSSQLKEDTTTGSYAGGIQYNIKTEP